MYPWMQSVVPTPPVWWCPCGCCRTNFPLLARRRFLALALLFWSAALGRDWAEGGRAGLGRKLPSEWGAGRPSRGGTVHRIPRFPPLADQVRYHCGVLACLSPSPHASRALWQSLVLDSYWVLAVGSLAAPVCAFLDCGDPL